MQCCRCKIQLCILGHQGRRYWISFILRSLVLVYPWFFLQDLSLLIQSLPFLTASFSPGALLSSHVALSGHPWTQTVIFFSAFLQFWVPGTSQWWCYHLTNKQTNKNLKALFLLKRLNTSRRKISTRCIFHTGQVTAGGLDLIFFNVVKIYYFIKLHELKRQF